MKDLNYYLELMKEGLEFGFYNNEYDFVYRQRDRMTKKMNDKLYRYVRDIDLKGE